jgi:non-haem Fe2+, alpha-ketoglutarate-dependent halogenase
MPNVLTQEQIDSYERDGFLSPVTVMSPEEAGEFRKALEDAEAKWPEAFEGAGRNNSHLNLKFMDELVHDSRNVDAVEDLIGPNLLAYGTVLFIKEPNTPGFVSWHQDATYMGLTPYTEATTVWLALSESNPETGCMRMVPGSHKDGIRSHVDTFAETNILTRGQDIQNVDESGIIDLELVPGQMSFHHMAVIHGSQPNLSNKRRIGFVIQCYMKPEMTQKVKPVYAQHVRGEDPYGNFLTTPRASGNMIPEDVARRDHCNDLWSDILYHGAEKRRDY